jgi:hypothetical protein
MVLILGIAIMIVCLGVQVGAVALIVRYYARAALKPPDRRPFVAIFRQLTWVMVVLLFASLVQMAIWAAMYYVNDQFPDYETSLYFSGVTFTSLGYGDLTLQPRVRLLSAMEASAGLMMFGVTSAIFVAAMQHSMKRLDAFVKSGG